MKKLGWALLSFLFSAQIQASPCVTMLKNSSKYTEFEVSFFTKFRAVNPYSTLRQLSLTSIPTEYGKFTFESEHNEWPIVPLLNLASNKSSPLYVGQYFERSYYYEAWNETTHKSYTFRIRRTFDARNKNLISSFIVSKSLANSTGYFEQRAKHEIPIQGMEPGEILKGVHDLFEIHETHQLHITPVMEVEAQRHSLKLVYTDKLSGTKTPIGFFAIGKVLTRSINNNLVVLGFGGELEIDWHHIESNSDIRKHKARIVELILAKSALQVSDQSKHDLVEEYLNSQSK